MPRSVTGTLGLAVKVQGTGDCFSATMSKSSSKKKKWAVVPLQSDMKKRAQRAFSTVILEAVSSGKSMSLQNLAKVVNENVNATTFGEWNVIVGRNFCNAIHYKRKNFYYGRFIKGGVNDLEFMIYRCGPKAKHATTTSDQKADVVRESGTGVAGTSAAQENNNSEGKVNLNGDIEIDSSIFDRINVIVAEHRMERPMLKTMVNIFRLSLSQKNTPGDDVSMLHTLSSKFIRSRLSMLYNEPEGHWQVIVGDATALEGAVNCCENCYAVLRAGNHKAIVFCHADNNIEEPTTLEKLVKMSYFLAGATFVLFLLLQNFVRNESCEILNSSEVGESGCTKSEIDRALFVKYAADKVPILIIICLIGATSVRMMKSMLDR